MNVKVGRSEYPKTATKANPRPTRLTGCSDMRGQAPSTPKWPRSGTNVGGGTWPILPLSSSVHLTSFLYGSSGPTLPPIGPSHLFSLWVGWTAQAGVFGRCQPCRHARRLAQSGSVKGVNAGRGLRSHPAPTPKKTLFLSGKRFFFEMESDW